MRSLTGEEFGTIAGPEEGSANIRVANRRA